VTPLDMLSEATPAQIANTRKIVARWTSTGEGERLHVVCAYLGLFALGLRRARDAWHRKATTLDRAWHDEMRCNKNAYAEVQRLTTRLAAYAETVCDFAEVVEAADRSHDKGGMQVPYHGDFASAVPSVRRDLRAWVARLQALEASHDEPVGRSDAEYAELLDALEASHVDE